MLRASVWADLVGDPDVLPVDPAAIARSLGVRIELVPLGDGVASVLRQSGGAVPLLLLATDGEPVDRRLACAHALGHWIACLGAGHPVDVVDHTELGRADHLDIEAEIFAGQFAMSLLTPARLVLDLAHGAPVDELAERFGVPASLMEARIGDLAVF